MPGKGRHIEVFQGADAWYYRVVGANGETMPVSEGYDGRNGKSHAVRAANDLLPELPIYIIDDEGQAVRLRPEDEVMGGPGPRPDPSTDG